MKIKPSFYNREHSTVKSPSFAWRRLSLMPSLILSLILVWGLAPLAVLAGTPDEIFVPEDNSVETTTDDVARAVNIKWYGDAIVQFYYLSNFDGDIFPYEPLDPTIDDPFDIIQAFAR